MKQRNKTHAQAGLYKMNRLHRVFGIARLLILISMIAAPLMPRQGQLAQLDLPLADLAKALAPDEAAAQTAAPGGVSGGLQLWLKADAGVTGSPSVSAWNDQTGNNRHVIENTTAFQPTLVAASAASNFNPSISFDGVNDNLDYKGVRFMPTSSSGTLMGAGSNKLDSGGYENFADLGIDNPHMGLYDDAGSFTDQIMWMNGSAPVQILHPTKLQGNKTQVYGYYWNGGSPNVGSGMRLDGSDFFEPTTEATFVGSSGTSDGMFSVGSYESVEVWNGNIHEVVLYNLNLSTGEKQRIETYLAIKYGTTITIANYIATDGTTTVWNQATNTGYNNNIAGIGRDDAEALVQKQSTSVNSGFQPVIGLGTLAATNALNSNTFNADKNYMVWGSNNLSATFGTAYAPTSYSPTTGYYRMNRVWKMQETGTVGSAQVQGPANANLMLVSLDPTFATGVTEVPLTSGLGAHNFANGVYFTFGAEATGPGGVAGNMTAWYKADLGVEAGGSAPANNASADTWLDQGLNSNDAFQSSGTLKPEWVENNGKFNFNPSVSFVPNARLQAQLSSTSWDNNDGSIYVIYNQETVYPYWRNLVDFGLTANDSNNPQVGMSDNDRIATWMDGFDRDNTPFQPKTNETRLAGYYWQFNVGGHSYSYDGQPYTGAAGHKLGAGAHGSGLDIGNFANIGGDPQLGEYFPGQIAEIVIYKEKHNATQQAQVQSYFGLKYGVTVDISPTNASAAQNFDYKDSGNATIWAGNSTNAGYHNNVAGIGRDDAAALNQKQSKSVNSGFQPVIGLGTIAATNALNGSTFAANKNFEVWGSNTAAATFGTVYSPTTFIPSTGYFRMTRVWRVQETGTVGSVQVRGPEAADYLLVSNDPTFATGVTEVAMADDGSGNMVAMRDFANGNYFTFGAPQTAPGGYASGLTLWARSTDGTSCTTSNCNMTDWDDFSGNANHMIEFGTSAGTTFKSADASFNFHPYVEATGGNVGFGKTALNMGNGARTVCVVHAVRTAQTYGTVAQFGPFDNPWMGHNSLAQTKWDDYVWAALDNVANTIPLNLPTLSCYSWTPGSKMSMGTNGKWLTSAQGTNTTPGVDFYLGYDQDGAGVADTNFGEVAVYQGTYTATAMAQIQSYFALRYGITLDQATATDYVASDGTTKTWTASANTGFNNDIAGIGRDDASALDQLQSKSVNSDDIVTMGVGPITTTNVANTGVFTANKSYLMWGNNNASATTTTALNVGTCAPPGITDKRINRVWKVQETGGIGSVSVQAALSAGFNISMPVYMLVGTDATFATYTSVPMTRNANGTYDTNYNFASGQFFTFAGNTTAPANICTDGDKYINWWNEGWNYGQKTKVVTKGSQTFTFNVTDPGNVLYVPAWYPHRYGGYVYIPRYDNSPSSAIQFRMQMSRPALSVDFVVCDIDGWYGGKDVTTFTGLLGGTSVGNPTITKGNDFWSNNYGLTLPSANSAQGANYWWDCYNPGRVSVEFKQPVDEIRIDYTKNNQYSFKQFNDLLIGAIDVTCAAPPPPPTPDNIYLTKRAPQGINPVDEAQTFSFEVQNLTCNPKTVSVADTLPSGLTYVGDSLSTNLTPTINAYSGTASLNLTNMTVNPGKYKFAIDVIGTVSNTYLNQAGVTVNGNTYLSDDPRQSGGSDATPLQLVTSPEPVAHITVTKSANVVSAPQNSVITYTFQITNGETSPVTVQFHDLLDGQMTYMTGTLVNPNGGTVQAYGGQGILDVFTMTLPVGLSTLSVQVNTNGTVTNTNTVNVAEVTPQLGSGYLTRRAYSNMANMLIANATPPDLTTVIGQPSPNFVVGAASNVPITVTNTVTAGATTGPITTTMTLPAGVSAPATFSNNGWTCTTTLQVVNCSNPGPIANGSSSTVQVPVTPAAATVGTTPAFTGSSSTVGETNTGNNAAPTMTPSVAVAAAPTSNPGGVTGGTLWLRADAGTSTTTNGAAVTSWTDQSGSGNNAGTAPISCTACSGTPTSGTYRAGSTASSAINFNPTVSFAGTYLDGSTGGMSTHEQYIVFFNPTGSGFERIVAHLGANGAAHSTPNQSGIYINYSNGNSGGTYSAGTGNNLIASNSGAQVAKTAPHVYRYIHTSASAATSTLDGITLAAAPSIAGTAPNTPFTNRPYRLGADLNGTSPCAGCYIAEVISFPAYGTATQRNQVESYLAAKYGVTLGTDSSTGNTSAQSYTASDGTTVYWTGNSTYQNRVTVIGRDDGTALNQKQSLSVVASTVPVTMGLTSIAADNASNANTFSADKNFVAFGDDTASTSVATVVSGLFGVTTRMARLWKVQETGTVSAVQVRVPASAIALSGGETAYLVRSTDSSIGSGDIAIALTLNGGNYEAMVDFANGDFFTFVKGLAATPDLTTAIGQPSPNFVAGSPSNVPMTVTNSGTGPTTGPITTTMTLPAGVSAPATFSNNGNTCNTAGLVVTCVNPGPIAAGGSNVIQVPVTPNATAVGTAPAFNGSTATPGETNTANNPASPMTPASAVTSNDTTPPVAPVITAPTTGSTVNDNTPLFSGTAEAGSIVTVKQGSTVLCTTTASNTGAWSCSSNIVLPDGNNTVNVTATDAAGNISPAASDTFTVATTPNLITAIGQAQPALMATQASTVPVTISNVGVSPTSGPITVSVTLPPATSAPASFSSNGWTCTAIQPADPFTSSTATCTSSASIPVNGSSTINVPVTPSTAAIGFPRTINATVAGGGEAITTDNAATPYTSAAVLPLARILPLKVFLGGPYDSVNGIMKDGLRARGMLPLQEPYTSLGYARAGAASETAANGVFSITGSAAPVDWVLVELRDASNISTVVATKAGLLLRNGYVKDVDAVNDLYFTGLTQGSYFVAIRHRNHLGAATANPITLSGNTPLVDFTGLAPGQINGANARRAIGNVYVLWAGDANGDKRMQAAGAGNDVSAINTAVLTHNNDNLQRNKPWSGYNRTDVNMDGDTTASGANNDIAVVVATVNANPANTTLNRNTVLNQQIP